MQSLSRSFSEKEEHRRDAYDTLESATFVAREATAVSQFEYGVRLDEVCK